MDLKAPTGQHLVLAAATLALAGATLAVDLPRHLTARQKELFEELKRSGA